MKMGIDTTDSIYRGRIWDIACIMIAIKVGRSLDGNWQETHTRANYAVFYQVFKTSVTAISVVNRIYLFIHILVSVVTQWRDHIIRCRVSVFILNILLVFIHAIRYVYTVISIWNPQSVWMINRIQVEIVATSRLHRWPNFIGLWSSTMQSVPSLLIWINCNPSMNSYTYPSTNAGWNLSILNLESYNHWRLGID